MVSKVGRGNTINHAITQWNQTKREALRLSSEVEKMRLQQEGNSWFFLNQVIKDPRMAVLVIGCFVSCCCIYK